MKIETKDKKQICLKRESGFENNMKLDFGWNWKFRDSKTLESENLKQGV